MVFKNQHSKNVSPNAGQNVVYVGNPTGLHRSRGKKLRKRLVSKYREIRYSLNNYFNQNIFFSFQYFVQLPIAFANDLTFQFEWLKEHKNNHETIFK